MSLQERPKADVTMVALHWSGDQAKNYLKTLSVNSPNWDFFTAFDIRDELAQMFIGGSPFFPRPVEGTSAATHRQYVESLCQ